MKKALLFFNTALLLVITGCQESEPDPGTTTFVTQLGGSCDYMNYREGTVLTFLFNGDTSIHTFFADTLLNGNAWLAAKADGDTAYYRCSLPYFYTLSLNGGGLGQPIELRPMKINGAAGDTWSDNVSIESIEVKYQHTILGIDGDRLVADSLYTDVAEVEVVASTIIGGTESVFSEYREYFSRSAGMIESTLSGGRLLLLDRED